MKQLFLTGFMGSGKSTIGQTLADALGLQGIDTDSVIEEQEKKSISEIFEKYGEEHFRNLETNVLQSLSNQKLLIITGGGIILRKENREWMKAHGVVIYLKCEMDEIKKRLRNDHTRPLLSGERMKEIETIFLSRKELYEEADLVIDTTGKTPSAIAQEIVECLKNR